MDGSWPCLTSMDWTFKRLNPKKAVSNSATCLFFLDKTCRFKSRTFQLGVGISTYMNGWLGGGCNPSEKDSSKWIISPSMVENNIWNHHHLVHFNRIKVAKYISHIWMFGNGLPLLGGSNPPTQDARLILEGFWRFPYHPGRAGGDSYLEGMNTDYLSPQ